MRSYYPPEKKRAQRKEEKIRETRRALLSMLPYDKSDSKKKEFFCLPPFHSTQPFANQVPRQNYREKKALNDWEFFAFLTLKKKIYFVAESVASRARSGLSLCVLLQYTPSTVESEEKKIHIGLVDDLLSIPAEISLKIDGVIGLKYPELLALRMAFREASSFRVYRRVEANWVRCSSRAQHFRTGPWQRSSDAQGSEAFYFVI
jgi:hypothetical protein